MFVNFSYLDSELFCFWTLFGFLCVSSATKLNSFWFLCVTYARKGFPCLLLITGMPLWAVMMQVVSFSVIAVRCCCTMMATCYSWSWRVVVSKSLGAYYVEWIGETMIWRELFVCEVSFNRSLWAVAVKTQESYVYSFWKKLQWGFMLNIPFFVLDGPMYNVGEYC